MTEEYHIPAFDPGKYPDHTKANDNVSLQFLDSLCTKAAFTVHLAAIDSAGHVQAVKSTDIRTQRTDIRMFLNTNTGCNLYFSQNHSNDKGMPDEASVTMLRAVVIDIDPLDTTSEEGWNAERLRIKQIVHGAIHHPHLKPSVVIDTGNGAQLVWLLQTELAGEVNKDLLRRTMKALAWRFSGDKATTHKASGLFRIPGTCNYPGPSKRQRGRHEAFGGIWFTDTGGARHKLDEFAELALKGAPVDPDNQSDDYFTAEKLGVELWQLIDAATDLPVTLGYRVNDKAQYDRAFKRLLEALQHPSDSKDRSGDDFRFAAVLHQDGFKPFEIAYCLAYYGARKAHPIGKRRWESYIVRTVLNVASKSGGKQEDFWVPPEPEEEEPPKAERSTEQPKSKTRRWTSHSEQASKSLDEVPALIDGLLPRRGLSMLYGDSNTGKSLVALLLCSCVASGEQFGGHEVETPGNTVFVAMEGGGGLHKRVRALALQYPNRNCDRMIYLTERYSLFEDPTSVNGAKALLDELRDIQKHVGHIDLLVIDMLAIAASGANENSGEDMSKILDRLERIEQDLTCHVLMLHHTGKNLAKGARGWSGMRGRVDTELEISPPKDPSVKGGFLRVSKQRDMDFNSAAVQGFMIRSLLLGRSAKGKPVTGATIELVGDLGAQGALTETEQDVLDAMREFNQPATMTDLVDITGKKMPNLTKILKSLIKKHYAYCIEGKPKLYAPIWIEEADAEPIDPFS